MKRLCGLSILLTYLVAASLGQQSKVIKYFDIAWKPCAKQEASYYRVISYDSSGNPTDTVKDYFISGQLQWKGVLTSEDPDINEGLCVWYYENGGTEQEANFINGKLNGTLTAYFEDGTLNKRANYKDGLLNGESIGYDGLKGKPIEFEYYVNGAQHGIQTYFYRNGQMDRLRVYKEGKLHGDVWSFHQNGQLRCKEYYENGFLQGERIEYNQRGEIISKGNFIDSKKEGEFHEYLYSGVLKEVCIYKHDKKIYLIEYYQNGLKKEERGQLNDSDYITKKWSDNGKLLFESYGNKRSYKSAEYDTSGALIRITIPDTLIILQFKEEMSGLYGFKNFKNEWVIPPRFNSCSGSRSFYIVTQNKKYGVVNYKGEICVPLIYDNIKFTFTDMRDEEYRDNYRPTKNYFPSAGFFKVSINKLWGIVDQTNRIVLPIKYTKPSDIINGMFVFGSGELYGFGDTSGYIVNPKFKGGVSLYYSNKDIVLYSDSRSNILKLGAVNYFGDVIIPCLYDRVETKKEGNMIWVMNDYKYGLYDIYGNKILDADYDSPYTEGCPSFSNIGLVALCKERKWGVIRIDGEVIFPFEYDSVVLFPPYNRENNPKPAGRILINKKWVVFDINGNLLTKPYEEMQQMVVIHDYEEVERTYYLYFLVRIENKYGVINALDSILIPLVNDIGFVDFHVFDRVMLIKDGLLSYYYGKDLIHPLEFSKVSWRSNIEQFRSSWGEFSSGVFDSSFNVILEPHYEVDIYDDQFIVYQDENEKIGVLDQNGKQLMPPDNHKSIDFIHGSLRVTTKTGEVSIFNIKQK